MKKDGIYLEENINQNYGTIIFRVKYITSLLEEEVHISGNIKQLGEWEPSKSLLMKRDENDYSYWKCTQNVNCPIGTELKYKYLIYNRKTKIIKKTASKG